MITVQHPTAPGNLTLEPLDLVDDYYFDEPSDYQPTAEDWAAVREADEAGQQTGTLLNLADFVRDNASFLRSQEDALPAEHWLADQLDQLARRVEFLGAETIDQYEVRNQTLLRDSLSVRPSNRVGHYKAWDVVDGLGGVQQCSDLFDAMMWIQRRLNG